MYYIILIPNFFKFLKLKYVLAKVQKGWQSKRTVDFQEDKTKIDTPGQNPGLCLSFQLPASPRGPKLFVGIALFLPDNHYIIISLLDNHYIFFA